MRHVPVDEGLVPPSAVRAAFALFVAEVAFSLLNVYIQISHQLSGYTALVGPAIEAVVFIVVGSRMRVGKLWARVAVMSLGWLFIAVGVLSVVGLAGAFGHRMDGLVWFAMGCVLVKIVLIISGIVMMYRPENLGYFR